MQATRGEVYDAVDRERAYQNDRYPVVGGFSASQEGFLLVLEELIALARAEVTQGKLWPLGDGAALAHHFRKIAATAVRAQEQYGVAYRGGGY